MWLIDLVKKFEIRIDDSVFLATMLEEQAPKTCKAALDLLPLKGELFHATWSGDMLFLRCSEIPAKLKPENQTIYPSPGDVGLSSTIKELQIIYGQAQLRARFGPAPDNIFARITENLTDLEKIGKRVHRQGPMRIVVRFTL
jgi:hypothetical protein